MKEASVGRISFQIQNEATGTIEHVIATSKDELARRALKVLNEGAQAIVKNSQGSLVGAIERHIENAQQNLLTQRNELDQYLDTMATGTVERVQRNLETSRTKATERFVLRLREQVAPVMEEARADLRNWRHLRPFSRKNRWQCTGKSRTNWKVTRTHDCFRLRTSWRKTPLPL